MSHGRKPTRDLDALSLTHNPPGAQKEKINERATSVPLSCVDDLFERPAGAASLGAELLDYIAVTELIHLRRGV